MNDDIRLLRREYGRHFDDVVAFIYGYKTDVEVVRRASVELERISAWARGFDSLLADRALAAHRTALEVWTRFNESAARSAG